jgi:hypothetical protein
MTQGEESSRNRKARVGIALIMLGFLLLLGNLGLIAAQLPQFVASLESQAMGVPAAVSLTLLRLFRTIAFHPAALLPLVCGILVVSFALIGILLGVILLRKRTVETAP